MYRRIFSLAATLLFSVIAMAQSGWQWGFPGLCAGGAIEAWPTAADEYGNVYSAALISTTSTVSVHFGSDSISGRNAVIVSADSNGNYRWSVCPGQGQVYGLAADRQGHIYVCGSIFGQVKIGTDSVTGSGTFLAKLNLSGTLVWLKKFDGFSGYFTTGGNCNPLAIDGSGNVFLLGYFTGTSLTLGTHTVTNTGSSTTSDLALAKLDSAGSVLWARDIGGTGMEYPLGIAAAAGGNVYVSGKYNSTSITVGTTALAGATTMYNFFTAKFDPSGAPVWANDIVSRNASNMVNCLSVDRWEHVFVTGQYSVNMIFGSDSFTSSTPLTFSMFLCQYDVNGGVDWIKTIGSSNAGHSVAPDNDGNIWAAVGGLSDQLSIYRVDTVGTIHDTLSLIAGGDDGLGLAVDNLGGLYLGTDFGVDLVINHDTLTRPGTPEQMFIARFSYSMTTHPGTDVLQVNPDPSPETITIYPNPSSGIFDLSMGAQAPGAKVTVTNFVGQTVYQQVMSGSAMQIDLSGQPDGIYFVHIAESNGLSRSQKLVKVK